LFLPEGPCEFPIDEELYKKISEEIDNKIGSSENSLKKRNKLL